MSWSARSAEKILGVYVDNRNQIFRVSEVSRRPEVFGSRHRLGVQIRDLLHRSWEERLVPDPLSAADVATKIPTAAEQERRIARPNRDARYLVACVGPDEYDDPTVQAFLRVEAYRRRRPPFQQYPNITDLETLDGQIDVGARYHKQAAALLHHAVRWWSYDRTVSAYTEEPNQDGINFYKRYGFHKDEDISQEALTETIGDSRLTYVHMVAGDVATVLDRIGVVDGLMGEASR